MCNTHNPILCIVPPYMLEKVVENGSEQLRNQAYRILKQSYYFRSQRTIIQQRPKYLWEILATGTDAHSFEKIRHVYDAKQGETLPGVLVRGEDDPPTGDVTVDEAYDAAGATWDFYMEEYGRNSIDDAGMIIDQTVHYGKNFNNAFWNGEQMVYGDGDGELFSRFTIDLDIIAHELTHGVTQFEANLVYSYQSGALNESFSDVFGSLVKQKKLNQEAKEADWLIGANVLVGEQYALRSMKAPGTAYKNHPIIGDDPQPATMDDYRTLPPWEDGGGVHINSGIPNYAFYLAALELGGKAWEKAGLIWYRTLSDKLRQDANFSRAARATIEVSREVFGSGSLEEQAVTKAWKEVKVL
ncbi:M4 family metallopeptidase [Lyngbya aestuarii]|uniref:M4 family metallopeptidase n=1 Tax=Lyngbya aestuarii TaxID=118322 RepID=UPI00403DE67B